MAADFFDHQDQARKQTSRLVFLFGLAVLGIAAMIYLVIASAISFSENSDQLLMAESPWSVFLTSDLWDTILFLKVSAGTFLIIAAASLSKMVQLQSGGAVIAEQLGGHRIDPNTTDALEKKLLNVVEEMAIASGTPTPLVYLLSDEGAINAFAAGVSPSDAVIGVTRGSITKLSRDELQGVIAHEFSHILNGDMRLNIRLIGILSGLLVVTNIGYYVLQFALHSSGRSRRSKDSGNPLPFMAVGAALMVIGFIGTFFGSMIKAAVSRQREFLADASAVQFTRNANGIAGALKKIGGFSLSSMMKSPNALEVSHLFFGQGISGWMELFATHPPLSDRIKRIDPSWQGAFPEVTADIVFEAPDAQSTMAFGFAAKKITPVEKPKESALAQIGRITKGHVQYAEALIQSLPEEIVETVHTSYSARTVIYALLINKDAKSRKIQMDFLSADSDCGAYDETVRLLPVISQLEKKVRLPLIDMALPALRTLTKCQYEQFHKNVMHLVDADYKINLFEWVLQRILIVHLEAAFEKRQPPLVQYYTLKRLQSHCEILLSALSFAGHHQKEQAQLAFHQAISHLNLPGATLQPMEMCGFEALGKSLDLLTHISPKLKRQLLAACAVSITADHEVTVDEAELLRAISDTLGCPMPPLLPGQSVI
ncbi:MAG: M48 family metallopeptidase [Nitrospirota bacterium]